MQDLLIQQWPSQFLPSATRPGGRGTEHTCLPLLIQWKCQLQSLLYAQRAHYSCDANNDLVPVFRSDTPTPQQCLPHLPTKARCLVVVPNHTTPWSENNLKQVFQSPILKVAQPTFILGTQSSGSLRYHSSHLPIFFTIGMWLDFATPVHFRSNTGAKHFKHSTVHMDKKVAGSNPTCCSVGRVSSLLLLLLLGDQAWDERACR